MGQNETLPKIKAKDIENAKNDAWDFLYIFLNKYHEIIEKDSSGEIMGKFSPLQHTLMAFQYIDSEVCNGGFIQLIQNGYGGYIFDNPFSEIIKSWGAEKIAEIVDEAKIIYNKYKNELEEEKTVEGFCELYSKIKDFEPLEEKYYEINDAETEKIKQYVEEHINEFGIII